MNSALIFLLTILFCFDAISSAQKYSCPVAECINNGNSNLSSVILCNECMVKVLSKSDTASLIQTVQQKVLNDNGRAKFTDLNTDVYFLILDELSILDTLNLLNAHPEKTLAAIAVATFARKYKDYTVSINAFPHSTELGTSRTIEMNLESIEVFQFELSKHLLRYFGSSIQRLEIKSHSERFPQQSHLYSILSQYIYKYAGKSLKYLNLDQINGQTFVYFNQPFEGVEELSLGTRSASNDEINLENVTLNALFPNLRRLELELHRDMNYNFIFCEFPRLDHVKLNVHLWNNDVIIKELLSKNTQIKSLETDKITQRFYNSINRYLPKLEHLNVTEMDQVRNARFDHVTSFAITYIENDQIEKISLPRLESLEVLYSREIDIDFIPFFRRHQNVSRLSVLKVFHDQNTLLINLMSNAPNLTEITIEHYMRYDTPSYEITMEIINETIAKNQKLEKFTLKTHFDFTETELNAIRERYAHDWQLNVIYYKRYFDDIIGLWSRDAMRMSFERKDFSDY